MNRPDAIARWNELIDEAIDLENAVEARPSGKATPAELDKDMEIANQLHRMLPLFAEKKPLCGFHYMYRDKTGRRSTVCIMDGLQHR